MISAFLSDIHANHVALDAVLNDMQRFRVDEIICLGDTVGYGPKPAECLGRVLELCKVSVLGNHDALAAFPRLDLKGLREDVVDGIILARSELGALQTEALGEMPLTVRSGDASCVHSSLADPAGFPYICEASDARDHFARQTTRVSFFGHTHVAEAWEREGSKRPRRIEPDGEELVLVEGRHYAVNAGSVGQPRDGDPRASYLIYNSAARVVRWRRVRYDIDEVTRTMASLGMSEFSAARLYRGM